MRLSVFDLPMFFTPEHRALGENLERTISPNDDALHNPKTAVSRLASLDRFKLFAPPSLGGPSFGQPPTTVDVRALCLVREALGFASPLADSIFAVHGLGSYPILLASDARDKVAFFERVTRGTSVGAFALTETEAGSDVASLRTTARREGDEWVIVGEKVFISNVGIANHFIVFANADPPLGKRGISAFLVPSTAPGLTTEPITMSVDHPLGRLKFEGCRVPANALIGEVGDGMRLALGTLDTFRASVGAAAVGMARRALVESIARVTSRIQFGKRLAEFQLTQSALATMATELDAARLLVFRAAWMKDMGLKTKTEVAMAKMFATEAAQRIIDRAVQLHGGVGVTVGSVVERLYREIRALRIYEGTTEIQQLIIGSELVRPKELTE